MASNYPIVQLIDKNGNIKNGRTFNWTIGVAKTGTSQSFDFTLPSGWNPDAYLLTVSAAGISSGQVLNVQMGTATTANLTLQPQFSLPTLIDVVANGSIESIWSLGSFASVMVSGDTSADLIVVNDGSLGSRAVVVNGNSGNDVVRMEASGSQTIVNGDDGDDITDFSFTNHNVANLSGSTVVNGGNGNDSIFIYDLADANPDLFIVNSVGVLRANWGGAIHNPTSKISRYIPELRPTRFWSFRPMPANIGSSTAPADKTPSRSAQRTSAQRRFSAASRSTTIRVLPTSSLTTPSIPPRRAIQIDNSGAFGVLLGMTPGLITWVNGDTNGITLTTGGGNDVMAIRATSKPFTILNSGGTDDNSMGNGVNGMQSIAAAVTFHAYFRRGQRLTLDDSTDTIGRTTSLTASGIDYTVGGLSPCLDHLPRLRKLQGV